MSRKYRVLAAMAIALLFLCASCEPVYIHDAVRSGDMAKVKAIIEKNPDLVNSPDAEGLTPLHMAAEKGNLPMVEFLVGKGAEIGAKDKKGQTALYLAGKQNHLEVAEFLRKQGAKE
ncbi:MAG: ankyrin repeat domain-containing protein [Candidatus Eremiobacteraeota bacterium]|nr:ankyrin repeat domain-containing protein [Candidatus Eremiobacteraeota bacterium]